MQPAESLKVFLITFVAAPIIDWVLWGYNGFYTSMMHGDRRFQVSTFGRAEGYSPFKLWKIRNYLIMALICGAANWLLDTAFIWPLTWSLIAMVVAHIYFTTSEGSHLIQISKDNADIENETKSYLDN